MAVNRRDIFWGYTAQLLNVGAGLILLPVIVRYFSPEDVGLWFVFITLAGLSQLLEFGFQPTLARNTAYVYAGAILENAFDLMFKSQRINCTTNCQQALSDWCQNVTNTST